MSPMYNHVARRIDAALVVLRLVTGIVFIAHGAQKLFTMGLPAITGGFQQMDIPYPEIVAPLVAILEFFGGIALVLGAVTRIVAFGLAVDMIGALFFVHLTNGLFLPNGFEFVLVLMGVCVALVMTGAGAYSVDALMTQRYRSHRVPPPTYAARAT